MLNLIVCDIAGGCSTCYLKAQKAEGHMHSFMGFRAFRFRNTFQRNPRSGLCFSWALLGDTQLSCQRPVCASAPSVSRCGREGKPCWCRKKKISFVLNISCLANWLTQCMSGYWWLIHTQRWMCYIQIAAPTCSGNYLLIALCSRSDTHTHKEESKAFPCVSDCLRATDANWRM